MIAKTGSVAHLVTVTGRTFCVLCTVVVVLWLVDAGLCGVSA
jgi:hypothetical protein